MTYRVEEWSWAVCQLCGAERSLGCETTAVAIDPFSGRKVLRARSPIEDRARSAGYRRLVLDSWDPVEYGTTVDGVICAPCFDVVLRVVNVLRGPLSIREERERRAAAHERGYVYSYQVGPAEESAAQRERDALIERLSTGRRP